MFRTAFCSAILLSAVLAGSTAARAEIRLALVIGESAYRAVPSLPNPANDARAMTRLLTDSGFAVTTASDLSQREMNQKVGDFTAEIAARGPDTIALGFMPAMACRSTARITSCPSTSIRSAKPTSRCRRCG